MSLLNKTYVALVAVLVLLAGAFVAIPIPEPPPGELTVSRTPLAADGSQGISDEDAAEARRSLQHARQELRQRSEQQEATRVPDPTAFGYETLDAMKQAVREQLGVPDEFEIVLVHEVRDGREGLGIGIGPRGI